MNKDPPSAGPIAHRNSPLHTENIATADFDTDEIHDTSIFELTHTQRNVCAI